MWRSYEASLIDVRPTSNGAPYNNAILTYGPYSIILRFRTNEEVWRGDGCPVEINDVAMFERGQQPRLCRTAQRALHRNNLQYYHILGLSRQDLNKRMNARNRAVTENGEI